ncbi:head GIN domain-containing protein [candidate division KSB1 bacterium]
MKSKISLTSVLIILIMFNVSCFININDAINSGTDNDEIIRASGVLETRELALPDFHSVEISIPGTVNISYGSEQEAVISVDNNAFDYIKIYVRSRNLRIDFKSGYQVRDMDLTLNLTMTDIRELCTNSTGSILGQNKFISEDILLETNSTGDIELELEAENLTTLINSTGDVRLYGSVNEHNAILNSTGDLRAFGFTSQKTVISLNSTGVAEVYVTGFLDVDIHSTGSLYYKGWPAIQRNITGIGSIINAN